LIPAALKKKPGKPSLADFSFGGVSRILAKVTVLLPRQSGDSVPQTSVLRELLIAFGILGICLVIHITGMVVLGEQLVRRRPQIERHLSFVHTSLLLMTVFSIVILLHVGEACVWAAFYYLRGLFADFETSLYFSMKTYSTIGYGDVLLPHDWRLVGTVEGITGVLLCGLSAAFLFAIVNALFRFRISQQLGRQDFRSNLSRQIRTSRVQQEALGNCFPGLGFASRVTSCSKETGYGTACGSKWVIA
jgi:hypothetical protein